MRVVKCVVQDYTPSEEVLALLEDFRLMLNDCIRIGVRENLTSMKSLSLKAYHQLSQYDVAAHYRLTAISKAAGILRNYRKSLRKNSPTKVPYVKKRALVDCYGFRLQGNRVRVTLRAREYAHIDLNAHTLEAIRHDSPRSVTLTPDTLSISYSREVEELVPTGFVGIDRNLANITTASSGGAIQTFELSKANQIKETYRAVKSHLKRSDVRIRRRVFGKYGILERNRVGWLLNNTSASLVNQAKEKRLGIIMEDIKGIRRLYGKGNGQGRRYRSRLNSWSYHELQRQIEYKARWEGIPVTYGSMGNECEVLDMWEQDIPE